MEDIPGTNITRVSFNAEISDYMFADTYWPAFKRSVQSGGAKGVMCSCNSVNGIPSCANDFLLNKTLRQDWGFDGYITSDSNNVANMYLTHNYTDSIPDAVIVSLQASTDIDSYLSTGMGGISDEYGTYSPYTNYIPNLVNNGLLDESLVDKALYNSFKIRFELGLFDQPINEQKYFNIPNTVINSEYHQELNVLASRQVMTLLKNDNHVLPLNPDMFTTKKLAVIGPHYNASTDLLLKGCYTGQICMDNTYDCVPSILTELSKYIPNSNNLIYAEGCNVPCQSNEGFNEAMTVANNADIIILLMGLNGTIESEGHDRVNISLPGLQYNLASMICNLNKPTILVLINGGIIAIDNLSNECNSIIEAFYPGFRGAQAISDTIFGESIPGGKLPVTMYWSNYTLPIYTNYSNMNINEGYGMTYKYWNGPEPIYPFAYGISYTSFKFTINMGCGLPQYCIDIKNTGNYNGTETIFVFMIPPGNTSIPSNEPASKVVKQLIDFNKYNININDEG